MANSQNGWPVVGHSEMFDGKVLGVEFPNGFLKGDVETVFKWLITQLNARVEKIDNGGCWGYYVKHIPGSNSISNHASGTAIDYNAPAHPLGVHNTYNAADRAEIHSILRYLEGTVRWGGDYNGRPDDMHFEIVGTPAEVRRVAAKITGGRKLTFIEFNARMPILKQGDSDSDFEGYDIIRRMQRQVGVKDDGVWGPVTSKALGFNITNEDRYRKLFGLSR